MLKIMKKILLLLVLVSISSCQTDFDDETIESLLTGTNQNIEDVESIAKEDVLYDYLTLISNDSDEELTNVGCIEFIYPFTLFKFDDTDNFINQVSVLGNENFAALLNDLEEGYSIGLSYPISGNLMDGTPVTVESNEQLQESLATCIEEELEIIIGNCNSIVTECVWKITESDNEESPYIDSFFTLQEDGSVLFSIVQENETEISNEDEEEQILEYETEVGTWIFYFIGADLHLNINFGPIENNEEEATDTDRIRTDWNFDWKVSYFDDTKIEIQKMYTEIIKTDATEVEETFTENIILEKECKEDE